MIFFVAVVGGDIILEFYTISEKNSFDKFDRLEIKYLRKVSRSFEIQFIFKAVNFRQFLRFFHEVL